MEEKYLPICIYSFQTSMHMNEEIKITKTQENDHDKNKQLLKLVMVASSVLNSFVSFFVH